MTHYLPKFTTRKGALQGAVCGARVTQDAHSTEPTCAKCAEWLTALHADEEETARGLEAEFPDMAGQLTAHEFDETDLALGKEE